MSRAGLVVVLCCGVLVAAPQASATVTFGSSAGSQVTLTSDSAGDLIHVRCGSTGKVQTDNGNGTFNFEFAGNQCANLQTLTVDANAGADNVQLGNVSAAEFPVLSVIHVNTGNDGAVDNLVGSQLADQITASSPDTIDAQDGNDTIDGGGSIFAGPGNDHLIAGSGTIDLGTGDDVTNSIQENESGGPGFDTSAVDATGQTIPDGFILTLSFADTQFRQTISGTGPALDQIVHWSGFEHVRWRLW